jgi:iron-sulfur cluster assembly 2
MQRQWMHLPVHSAMWCAIRRSCSRNLRTGSCTSTGSIYGIGNCSTTHHSYINRMITNRSHTSTSVTQETSRRSQLQMQLVHVNQRHTVQSPSLPHIRARTMVLITQTKANLEVTTSNAGTTTAAAAESATTSESTTPIHTINSNSDTGSSSKSPQNLSVDSSSSSQSVLVTDACYQRIRHLISQKQAKQTLEEGDNIDYYLRVFVDAGGCSGFTYQFELDTNDHIDAKEDVIFTDPTPIPTTTITSSMTTINTNTSTSTSTAARVIIDRVSLQLLSGSTIDYVQEMIKSTFEVRDNPQSVSACGCGSSFALKTFAANPAMD